MESPKTSSDKIWTYAIQQRLDLYPYAIEPVGGISFLLPSIIVGAYFLVKALLALAVIAGGIWAVWQIVNYINANQAKGDYPFLKYETCEDARRFGLALDDHLADLVQECSSHNYTLHRQ